MTDQIETNNPPVPKHPAKVLKVLDEYKVVINRGSIDGIKEGQRFLIYDLSDEEIKDIDTNESLGFLEIVKGIGRVIHVQEKLATLESAQIMPSEKRIIKSSSEANLWIIRSPTVEETVVEPPKIKPFEDPMRGDMVKPI